MKNKSDVTPNESMTSACQILQTMLKSLPKQDGYTVSKEADAVVIDRTYNKDTNALIRAKFACDQGLVVSPLSESSTLFYTKPENFSAEKNAAKDLGHRVLNRSSL